MKVWTLDFGDGVEHAYTTPEKAFRAAWDWLLEEGYDPEDEECGFFDELKESYEDERYSGFEVDAVLLCQEVEVD